MKRVGVVLRMEEINNISKHYVRDSLINKLLKYNIEIICIPINDNLNNIYNIINECNGIIFPGGDDINDIDIKMIEFCHKKDIPTLGICLGMQEMSFYNKGLINDLNDDSHYNKYHDIKINKNSLLYKILKTNRILVNSIHRSYVCKTKFDVSAISEDNIIEAIEDKNKKFFLGVQWHPERMEEGESTLLFDYFISKL